MRKENRYSRFGQRVLGRHKSGLPIPSPHRQPQVAFFPLSSLVDAGNRRVAQLRTRPAEAENGTHLTCPIFVKPLRGVGANRRVGLSIRTQGVVTGRIRFA